MEDTTNSVIAGFESVKLSSRVLLIEKVAKDNNEKTKWVIKVANQDSWYENLFDDLEKAHKVFEQAVSYIKTSEVKVYELYWKELLKNSKDLIEGYYA